MRFRGLSPLCADTLLHVPELLRSEDPAVRARLLPDAYDNDDDEQQWRRYARPHIEHLFADRIQIVEGDLRTLREDAGAEYELRIPARHRSAWLSALNGARIAMFIEAGLKAADMDAEPGTLVDVDQDICLLKIHLLAFVQELMLEAGGYADLDDEEEPQDEEEGEAGA